MTLKEFATLSGVLIERCDKIWGGTWAYKLVDSPNCLICGYRDEISAYKGWAKETFGEKPYKALVKLLTV